MSLWCHDQKPKGSGIIEGVLKGFVYILHISSHMPSLSSDLACTVSAVN